MNRSFDWLRQAEDDFLWAQDTLSSGRYGQACFVCQQCAEKALKALALHRGFDRVKSHSILEIARALGVQNDDLLSAAKQLDLYYISTRYPDAFPTGAPFEYFTAKQANEAVLCAEQWLQHVRGEMGSDR